MNGFQAFQFSFAKVPSNLNFRYLLNWKFSSILSKWRKYNELLFCKYSFMVFNYNIFLGFTTKILSFSLILQIYPCIIFLQDCFSVFLPPGNFYKNSIFNLVSKLKLNYQTFQTLQKLLLWVISNMYHIYPVRIGFC